MATAPYSNAQAVFYQQYEQVRRDEVVGILLALFLGTFGLHHFYLRRTGLGILYCCFFWTGISAMLGFIECFFMPGRDTGCGNRGGAGDLDAGLGSANQRDGEHAARSGWVLCCAAGHARRLRTMPEDQSSGSAILLGVRGGAVTNRQKPRARTTTYWRGRSALTR